jgi:DNA-binding Lrp family transcriptional regulator
MIKFDDLDAKILNQLLQNGRESFVNIAKKTHVSKDVIAKRYNAMEKAGIIVGSTTQISYRFFGYSVFASIFINVKVGYEEEVIKHLKKIPNTKDIFPAFTNFNILINVTLRNLHELEDVKEIIRSEKNVLGLKTLLWLEIINMPENLFSKLKLLEEETNASPQEGKKSNQKLENIDAIDVQLVEKLSKNGRLAFKKIAEELNTSTDTIIRRYEKLRKLKAVKVTILIDPRKLGYQALANFSLSLTSKSNSGETIKQLTRIPNIYHIVKTSGEYDLFVLAIIKDFKEFFTIREKITQFPNVKIVGTEIEELLRNYPGYHTYISTFS